ncbi:hypothetical protein I4U23_020177 [Adineta vaga]|nr:hypothetical protein I4U23_020177 [Adineta vaga]
MASSTVNSPYRKLALILSNGNYSESYNQLNNAEENAKALKSSLKQIGFQVTTVCDKGKHDMNTAIIDFCRTIRNGDIVLLYFFGHCYQVKGKNYIIPVGDNEIEEDRDVEDFAVDLDRTLGRLVEKNSSFVNIFVLDCNGTYSLQKNTASSSTNKRKGVPEMKQLDGLFIQCACSTNESTRNNLFTKHLLNNIQEANVNIPDLFCQISKDVLKESDKKQRPLSINGLNLDREVYLNEVKRQKWDDLDNEEIPPLMKKQEELRDCYDNYPNVDDVINRDTPDMKKADELTESLLSTQPSGKVTDKNTVFHALNNLMADNNQECVFFDSKQGMKLHDASANLTDLNVKERPFVLKLKSNEDFVDYRDPKDKIFDLKVIKTLDSAIEQNESHPVIDDIVEKLAKAHDTDKSNIVVKNVYLGSFNIVYTVNDITSNVVKKLTSAYRKLKEQFKQFVAAKIHPLLFRPSFDIAQFDAGGDKTFAAPSSHQVGPPGRTKEYISPVGYTRYGLKVLGKYETDEWLHPFGIPGNWYRAFHGTGRATAADFGKSGEPIDREFACVDAASNIHKTGFRKARIHFHGEGVYCSPKSTFVEEGYAGEVTMDTIEGKKKFKMMLQVAVSPDDVKIVGNDIWVVSHPESIRTYGILIKEV